MYMGRDITKGHRNHRKDTKAMTSVSNTELNMDDCMFTMGDMRKICAG
jgi:hypothetical protein